MIRQKIVTQCSLIRLPGFPDNTVINYVFCPHVFVPKFRFFFFLFQDYISCLPLRSFSLISYYCNPGLIKSWDRTGGVWCGSRIMLSAHLSTQLLAVVFSLIAPCQYANKLPRLFPILGLQWKIYDRSDDFFFLLLPMHLFMGSRRVVCAVLLLLSFSKLLSLGYVLAALYVSQLLSCWGVSVMGSGKDGHHIYIHI